MLKYLTTAGVTGLIMTGTAHAQLITADITVDGETRTYSFETFDDIEETSLDEILADFGFTDIDETQTVSIGGLFAGQSFTYSDDRDGNLQLDLIIEDADAFFAGIRDIDPNASISDDDLRLYEAIFEGSPLSLSINEGSSTTVLDIGNGAVVINYDDTTGAGTVTIEGQGTTNFTSGGQSVDVLILDALDDRIQDVSDDNGQLSALLALFTPNSIASTFDDPIAGNPSSVVGRMPGLLADMHTRRLPEGKTYGFFGKLEYEGVNYDNSGDASVVSGDLAVHFAAGPGEVSLTVPLAYVEYDGGEQVGHGGLILGYGLDMNDLITELPLEWTTQATIGAIGGTSDALVDTAVIASYGVSNRFVTGVTEQLDLGLELDLSYIDSPDIEFDDYTQTYNLGITTVTYGVVGSYRMYSGLVIDGALRRTDFSGETLAIDAQNELEVLVSGSPSFKAGVTIGFGDEYSSLGGQLKFRF
ncbi:MAG: hypothetical protein CMK07_09960 [Ponticaulis sp.]|nr:hypothetical protein [Ponticaulis sp.]